MMLDLAMGALGVAALSTIAGIAAYVFADAAPQWGRIWSLACSAVGPINIRPFVIFRQFGGSIHRSFKVVETFVAGLMRARRGANEGVSPRSIYRRLPDGRPPRRQANVSTTSGASAASPAPRLSQLRAVEAGAELTGEAAHG